MKLIRVAVIVAGLLAGLAWVPARAVDVSASMEVPLFFNDHHIYAGPDTLRHDRVLAAIVKDGVILVPLRGMFEQMGATVTYDAATKKITVARGANTVISVQIGSAQVVINGESRPLDVPPMMYRGVLVVPVRVISEALGAYVEWLPDRRVVIIRYNPPTPPPTPAATAPPPQPTPAPHPPEYTGFIQAALIAEGKDYNEFHNGPYCRNGSFVGDVLYRPVPNVAIKVDTRQDRYVTTTGFTDSLGNQFTVFGTIDGGVARVPVFMAQQNTFDVRLEFRVASPNLYVGVADVQSSTNYGYPRLRGLGFGLEKLPDFTAPLSVYASAYYYPSATGNYTVDQTGSPNFGTSYRQQYGILRYDIGADWQFSGNAPVYVFGGFSGDRFNVKANAPIGQTHSGFYAGLGLRY